MQIPCLPWSYTDPRLHGWFVISGPAQQLCCHSTSKWSWLLSHQAGQAELSLIQLLCRPSLHHTQVTLLEHNSSSLTPKTSMRKPGEPPRTMAGGTRGHKPLLLPARHKALTAQLPREYLKSCLTTVSRCIHKEQEI